MANVIQREGEQSRHSRDRLSCYGRCRMWMCVNERGSKDAGKLSWWAGLFAASNSAQGGLCDD